MDHEYDEIRLYKLATYTCQLAPSPVCKMLYFTDRLELAGW